MIATVLRVSLLELLRDRLALVLTFVLPLIFFSVFAAVFAAMDDAKARTVRTIVVVDPAPSFATRLADRLGEKPGIDVVRMGPAGRRAALEAVGSGEAAVALLLPSGLRPSLTGGSPEDEPVELHADRSNPLAVDVVSGLLQASAAELFTERVLPKADVSGAGVVPVKIVDPLGGSGKRPSISFFAAGLGVMFLMFAVAARGSILLEERENGVLGRLLAARVGMTRLLLGRWLFLVILGATEVVVMFLWAAVAFGLDLFTPRHLAGFAVTTLAISAAASAFGLILSALCRTRAQLNNVATVAILTLSVIGGNMFPSFFMPAAMQSVGGLTFNAWALAAYRKVFWYEMPPADLAPEVGGLAAATVVFLLTARWLARRWEKMGGSST